MKQCDSFISGKRCRRPLGHTGSHQTMHVMGWPKWREIQNDDTSVDSGIDTKAVYNQYVFEPDEVSSGTLRPSWDEYFINIANIIATRSTCLRSRFGAVIVTPDHDIIATGYNGAPSGVLSCLDRRTCYRKENNVPNRKEYENCYSVHAEINAMLRCKTSVRGCTLYIGNNNEGCEYTGGNEPCFMCKRAMINAGIEKCVYKGNKSELIHMLMKDIKLI